MRRFILRRPDQHYEVPGLDLPPVFLYELRLSVADRLFLV
jgi:hypothetical protein